MVIAKRKGEASGLVTTLFRIAETHTPVPKDYQSWALRKCSSSFKLGNFCTEHISPAAKRTPLVGRAYLSSESVFLLLW